MYPRRFFSMFYSSFAKSVVLYALLAYGATVKTYLEPIEGALWRLIRLNFFEKPSESSQLILEKLQLLTAYELSIGEVMSKLFKQSLGLLSAQFLPVIFRSGKCKYTKERNMSASCILYSH